MSFSEIWVPMVIVLGFTLLLILLLWAFFKDTKKVGFIVSVFLILSFSYGRVFEVIRELQIGNFMIGRHWVLLLIWGILFTGSFYFIVKTDRNLRGLTNFLNIIAVSLVMISSVNIVAYGLKTRVFLNQNRNTENEEITGPIEKKESCRIFIISYWMDMRVPVR